MNGLKRLQIEYEGISGIIGHYTSESNIMNYLIKLEEGMNSLDYEVVLYSLDLIIKWYEKNIGEIRTNYFVSNFDSHKDNLALLKEIRETLKPEDFMLTSSNKEEGGEGKKLIFLSHRSSDKKFGHALRNFLIGLGIKNDQLIYTSHPMHNGCKYIRLFERKYKLQHFYDYSLV